MLKKRGKDTSFYVPIWKLLLFYVITLGLYFFYWYYQNWKFIREKDKVSRDVSPILRTLSVLVPIINLVILFDFFHTLLEILSKKKIKSNTTATQWFVLVIVFNFLGYLWWPFSFLNLITLSKFQLYVNKYCAKKENISLFNIQEIVFVAVCIILLVIYYF